MPRFIDETTEAGKFESYDNPVKPEDFILFEKINKYFIVTGDICPIFSQVFQICQKIKFKGG